MNHQREHFVWVERYRPQTLGECILPAAVKATLEAAVKQQNVTNLLLTGRAGTGKTTVAKALVRDMDADALVINASEEGNIDTLRNRIRDFASSMTLGGGRKYVILDEADYLTAATQPALRAFMEEFAKNCGFILTANFPQRIIAPLHSRCSVVDFKIPATERVALMQAFWKRACDILTLEQVKHDPKTVSQVIALHFPDFRRVLNELQRYSADGELSPAILSQLTDKDVAELFVALKSKDYAKMRKWVVNHEDMDPSAFYRMLGEHVPKHVDIACLPELIVTMADYGYRVAFCADAQINVLACLVELMSGAQWKS